MSNPSFLDTRAFAEYVVVPEAPILPPIPAGVEMAEAGPLGLAGAAAWPVVDAVAPAEGEAVLVSGATGGVGTYAVQLAAARGATVIATAESGQDADIVRGPCRAHVVDYIGDIAAQVQAIRPDGVDAVIHAAGGGRRWGRCSHLRHPASTLLMSPDQADVVFFKLQI